MGIGGFSVGSLVLILVIVMLLFGTKRVRSMGEDLGAALRSFKKGVGATGEDADKTDDNAVMKSQEPSTTGKVTDKK